MESRSYRISKMLALCIVLALGAFALYGCEGDDGAQGPPGPSTGIVRGTVTNDATDGPISDVTVTTNPAIEGVSISTDGSGNYSASLPTGNYTFTYSKPNFQSFTRTVTSFAGQTTTVDVSLSPTSGVIVDAGANVTGVSPGSAVNLSSGTTILDGSSILSIEWTQQGSVPVTILNGTTASPTVVLPGLDAYKDELFHVLAEPPITAEQLPPNVPVPEGEFVGGLQNRSGVQAINPFALEEAVKVTMEASVTTTTGTFTDEVEIDAVLPWKANGGTRNVPIGVPVLLHGRDMGDSSWNWTLSPPGGSGAALDNSTAQNPSFTPDTAGLYRAVVANSGAVTNTIDVFAGTWTGVITGQDAEGRPTWDTGCTFCHDDDTAPDEFTPWKDSGHAEIFTDNFNTSTHYSTSCLPCHTVGFDTAPLANNDGIDDQPDYAIFLSQFSDGRGNFIPDTDNWTNMLANTPDSARRANIQCENCHGPNTTDAHPRTDVLEDDPRINLSSDGCAHCHGEPLRHARFQQWQLSRHANYELAIEEGENQFCSRCHTANGFIRWIELLEEGSAPDVGLTVTWNENTIHPQTCPTCHSPHFPGNISGDPNTATVRVADTTPPLLAGFTAVGVGRGAICMTCHNTRRGLRNDTALPVFDEGRAPHAGAQTDVIMGENAYFVEVGARSPHSFLPDTCATCHMERTPPPALLSYDLGGTNHTFFASITICAQCHTGIEGEDIQASVETEIENLRTSLDTAIETIINTHLATKDVLLASAQNVTTGMVANVPINSGNTITAGNFGSSGGRQSIEVTLLGATYSVQLRRITTDSENVEIFGPINTSTGFAESQVALKAGWNLLLVEDDKSKGVHNPRFVFSILGATRNALAGTSFITNTPL